ncbi:MAG: diacylglycerol kinase family lipid kinase [Oscillospiraceae bacterium]|nr:diacylglycerol kinase family lipid kinase [Oscillospiraceae bacterium]
MAKKVLIIINPCAGRIPITSRSLNLGEKFWKAGFETDVRMTTGHGNATELAQKLASSCDLIVCRGGDGTLNEVVNGVMKSGCIRPIGYIPSGTTNDFARSNAISLDHDEAAEMIINGSPVFHDIGAFNDDLFFVYTATFGVFSKSSYATSQKAKNRYGYLAYLASGAKEVSNMRVIKTRVICDGQEFYGNYVFGSITNSLTVGNILKYDRGLVNFDDGVFELILAKKPPSIKALVELVGNVRKQKIDERYLTFLQGREITIECDDDIPWCVDGDFGGNHRIADIKCINGKVSIYKGSEKV